MAMEITGIESAEFPHPLDALGTDQHGVNLVYTPGESVGGNSPDPAQRHCIAATRNTNSFELALVHPDAPTTQPPVYEGDYWDMLDIVNDESCVEVSEGPDLGVSSDWGEIETRATGGVHVYE